MSDTGAVLARQRGFFRTGATRDVDFRIAQLKALKRALARHEPRLMQALRDDLHKPDLEAYSSEIGVTLAEVNVALRNVRAWARPKRVWPHVTQFPNDGVVIAEPLGVALIIAPWNYPMVLLFAPLVAAISAGNCAVLKPSELAPRSSQAVAELVADAFDPGHVTVVQGGPDAAQALLAERWDKIMYTGGGRVGRMVAEAAARHLTPVTLELGGKSPAIVDATAAIDRSAKRIVWGKFWNAGQTCIAPDYVLAQRAVFQPLVEAMQRHLRAFYGDDPKRSPHLARIVNDAHFARLAGYLSDGVIVHGGATDRAERYVAPTIMTQVPADSGLMTDEVFGPILPVRAFDELDEAVEFVNERPKPLALYVFSRDKRAQQRLLSECSFGGGCVNDTVTHFAQSAMPFGGVGASGVGNYRGRYGFEAFSNLKGVLKKGVVSADFLVRYPPYSGLKQRLTKWFMR